MLMFWFQYHHLGKSPELLWWSFHISVVTYMYPGGIMGMAECILQGPGNFKTFHDLPYGYSPWIWWYFKTFCDHSPNDGILFQDLPWLSQSAPHTPLPTHTHTHIITEATSHKQSMLYWLQLEIQEIHFQNTCTRHFNIMVSTRKAHGADYKALCKTFLLESFKYTYLNS